MSYFFRGVEDLPASPLKPYSFLHLLMLGIFLLGAFILSNPNFGRFKGLVRKDGPGHTEEYDVSQLRRRLSRFIAWILLIDQLILYSWQLGSSYFRWDMSLPLYHCRIAIWLLIVGVLADKKTVLRAGMYWGIAGAFVALAFPDLYAFSFPHYTNFQFFIAHIGMGWLIFNLLADESIKISRRDTRKVLLISTFYNCGLFVFNLLMQKSFPGTDYGYTLSFPDYIPVRLAPLPHLLLFTLLFSGLILLIGRAFERNKKEYGFFKQIKKTLFSIPD